MQTDNGFDLNDYPAWCGRTIDHSRNGTDRALVTALGLSGEAGEVADLIKKAVFHSKPLDRDALRLELGDVLWYLTAACEAHGFTLAEVAAANVEKLKKRYPDGCSFGASTI